MGNRITKYDIIISAIILIIGCFYIFSKYQDYKRDQMALDKIYPPLNFNDSINDRVKEIYLLQQNSSRRLFLKTEKGKYLSILSYSISNDLSISNVIDNNSKLVKSSGSDTLMVISYSTKDSTVHFFKLE